MNNKQGRDGTNRLVLLQIILTGIIASLAMYSGRLDLVKSFCSAALVAILPNLYFGWKLFKVQGAKEAKRIVSNFYKAEAIKFVLTFFLFALVFIFVSIQPMAFFIYYVALQMLIWFAPIIFPETTLAKK